MLVGGCVFQLQRMLPGGLCICGIAVVGADLAASSTKLQHIMAATYKKICQSDLHSSQTENWQLILVDNLSKRYDVCYW